MINHVTLDETSTLVVGILQAFPLGLGVVCRGFGDKNEEKIICRFPMLALDWSRVLGFLNQFV